jgi:uncharacterized protein (DUF3820 family)
MNPAGQDELARTLGEIARTHMPFGKYGPKEYPPRGVPIYDLPYEYLAWFARKGAFPKGRLGELLEFVYLAKRDGADAVFDPVRKIRGGRTSLRSERQTNWSFEDDE